MPVLDDVVRRIAESSQASASVLSSTKRLTRHDERSRAHSASRILSIRPAFFEARCNSIEETELVNALCRLAEYAE